MSFSRKLVIARSESDEAIQASRLAGLLRCARNDDTGTRRHTGSAPTSTAATMHGSLPRTLQE
jgi:hypothetical protein